MTGKTLRWAVLVCAALVALRVSLLIADNLAMGGAMAMGLAMTIGATAAKLPEGPRAGFAMGLVATFHACLSLGVLGLQGAGPSDWILGVAYLAAAVGLWMSAARLRRLEARTAQDTGASTP